jgi:L-ascorbate metabolism protein UlaG (beta-lactamase superfamily)
MKSIEMIKDKTEKFLIPLAVKPHLKRWGVDDNKISEFDWWQNYSTEDIEFTFAPARHFSGRGTSNRNSTLWGSWIIETKEVKIFHSGDSGYGNHFKEINNKYGNFDFAFIECGQYNENWAAIHMAPEQSVQAALDLEADFMMPIHWGAFTLGLHPWNEPAIRSHNHAYKLNQNIISPIIGEIVEIPVKSQLKNNWWTD